jgi:hypothetical protein
MVWYLIKNRDTILVYYNPIYAYTLQVEFSLKILN